jgi:hypothetical protein
MLGGCIGSSKDESYLKLSSDTGAKRTPLFFRVMINQEAHVSRTFV